MFDKLIDILRECFSFFVPFVVIRSYERGVRLRFGIARDVCEPGFHWCIPFNVDEVLHDNVAPRTYNLAPQSLTTADGRSVVVGAVITAEICDIRRALLEVENVDHAIADSCYGAVGAFVASKTWDDLRTCFRHLDLLINCRETAFIYGVEITCVQLSDLALARSIRLHTHEQLRIEAIG